MPLQRSAFSFLVLVGCVGSALAPAAETVISGTDSGPVTHSAADVAAIENYTAESTADVVVTAGSTIVLRPGVSIQAGARFRLRPGVAPPTVAMQSPADGATFTEGDDILLTASAGDTDGTVAGVTFAVDGATLGSGADNGDGSWSFAWNGAAIGTFALSATATDSQGAVATSAAVSVTVETASNLNAADDAFAMPATAVVLEPTGGVAGNDTIPEGGGTFSLATPPSGGHIEFDSDGTFRYVPALGTSADSFTYTLDEDGGTGTDTGTVTITVDPGTDTYAGILAFSPIEQVLPTDAETSHLIAITASAALPSEGLTVAVTGDDGAMLVIDLPGGASGAVAQFAWPTPVPSDPATRPDLTLTLRPPSADDLDPATDQVVLRFADEDEVIAAADVYYLVDGVSIATSPAEGVLTNDYTDGSDPLQAVLVSGPTPTTTGMAFTLNPDGSFDYQAGTVSVDGQEVPYEGPASFTYQAVAGTLESLEVTVHLLQEPQRFESPGLHQDPQGDGSQVPAQASLVNPYSLTVEGDFGSADDPSAIIFNGTNLGTGADLDNRLFAREIGLPRDPTGSVALTVEVVGGDGASTQMSGRFKWAPTPIADEMSVDLRPGDAILAAGSIGGSIAIAKPDGSTSTVPLDAYGREAIAFDQVGTHTLRALDADGLEEGASTVTVFGDPLANVTFPMLWPMVDTSIPLDGLLPAGVEIVAVDPAKATQSDSYEFNGGFADPVLAAQEDGSLDFRAGEYGRWHMVARLVESKAIISKSELVNVEITFDEFVGTGTVQDFGSGLGVDAVAYGTMRVRPAIPLADLNLALGYHDVPGSDPDGGSASIFYAFDTSLIDQYVLSSTDTFHTAVPFGHRYTLDGHFGSDPAFSYTQVPVSDADAQALTEDGEALWGFPVVIGVSGSWDSQNGMDARALIHSTLPDGTVSYGSVPIELMIYDLTTTDAQYDDRHGLSQGSLEFTGAGDQGEPGLIYRQQDIPLVRTVLHSAGEGSLCETGLVARKVMLRNNLEYTWDSHQSFVEQSAVGLDYWEWVPSPHAIRPVAIPVDELTDVPRNSQAVSDDAWHRAERLSDALVLDLAADGDWWLGFASSYHLALPLGNDEYLLFDRHTVFADYPDLDDLKGRPSGLRDPRERLAPTEGEDGVLLKNEGGGYVFHQISAPGWYLQATPSETGAISAPYPQVRGYEALFVFNETDNLYEIDPDLAVSAPSFQGFAPLAPEGDPAVVFDFVTPSVSEGTVNGEYFYTYNSKPIPPDFPYFVDHVVDTTDGFITITVPPENFLTLDPDNTEPLPNSDTDLPFSDFTGSTKPTSPTDFYVRAIPYNPGGGNFAQWPAWIPGWWRNSDGSIDTLYVENPPLGDYLIPFEEINDPSGDFENYMRVKYHFDANGQVKIPLAGAELTGGHYRFAIGHDVLEQIPERRDHTGTGSLKAAMKIDFYDRIMVFAPDASTALDDTIGIQIANSPRELSYDEGWPGDAGTLFDPVVWTQSEFTTATSIELERTGTAINLFYDNDPSQPVFATDAHLASVEFEAFTPTNPDPDKFYFRPKRAIHVQTDVTGTLHLDLAAGNATASMVFRVGGSGTGGRPDDLEPAFTAAADHAAVRLADGNLNFLLPVHAFDSPLPGPDLALAYNSFSKRDVGLGPGWTHTYDMRIEPVFEDDAVDPATGRPHPTGYTVYDGVGNAFVFDGNGFGTPDSRAPNAVLFGPDTPHQGPEAAIWPYEVRLYDGNRYFFADVDDTVGGTPRQEIRLVAIRDIRGHQIDVDWQNGTVSDSAGRSVDLTPGAGFGKLTATGYSEQSGWQATLTGDRLTGFDRELSGSWTFGYDAEGHLETAKISDANFTHSATDEFLEWTFTYEQDAGGTPTERVVAVVRPTLEGGPGETVALILYDSANDPDIKVEDPENGVMEFEYDPALAMWTTFTDTVNPATSQQAWTSDPETTAYRILEHSVAGTGDQSPAGIQVLELVPDPACSIRSIVRVVETHRTNKQRLDSSGSPLLVTEREWYPIDQDGYGNRLPGAFLPQSVTVRDVELSTGGPTADLTTTFAYVPATESGTRAGLLREQVEPDGGTGDDAGTHRTTYAYDESGFLTGRAEADVALGLEEDGTPSTGAPVDLVWQYADFTPYGEPRTVISPAKGTDAERPAGKYPFAGDQTLSYLPAGVGLLATATDHWGLATALTYDRFRNPATVDLPGGAQTWDRAATWNALGVMVEGRTRNNQNAELVATYVHDVRGRETEFDPPGAEAVRTTYQFISDDPVGELWKVVETQKKVTEDPDTGNPVETDVQLSAAWIDLGGRVVREEHLVTMGGPTEAENIDADTPATRVSTTHEFDPAHGWQVDSFFGRVGGPDQAHLLHTRNAVRDDFGRVTRFEVRGADPTTDPLIFFESEFNRLGWTLAESDADGIAAPTPHHNRRGQVVKMVNPRGFERHVVFNDLGLPLETWTVSTLRGQSPPERTWYYADGQIFRRYNSFGVCTENRPDAAAKTVLTRICGTEVEVTDAFGADGNLESRQTFRGTTTYQYYANLALKSIFPPQNKAKVEVGRDDQDRPVDIATGEQEVLHEKWSHSPDGTVADRVDREGVKETTEKARDTHEINAICRSVADTSLTEPVDVTRVLQRDPFGRVLRGEGQDGTEVTIAYTPLGQSAKQVVLAPVEGGGTQEITTTWEYSKAGRLEEEKETVESGATTTKVYTYDPTLGLRASLDHESVEDGETEILPGWKILEFADDGRVRLYEDTQTRIVTALVRNPNGQIAYELRGDGKGFHHLYYEEGKDAGRLKEKRELEIQVEDNRPKQDDEDLPEVEDSRLQAAFTYDQKQRVLTIAAADGTMRETAYDDGTGDHAQMITRAGETLRRETPTTDEHGRMVAKTIEQNPTGSVPDLPQDVQTLTMDHDKMLEGDPITLSDGRTAEVVAHRSVLTTDQSGATVENRRDRVRRQIYRRLGTQDPVLSQYNALGQRVSHGGDTYQYNSATGHLSGITRAGGVGIDLSYDDRGRAYKLELTHDNIELLTTVLDRDNWDRVIGRRHSSDGDPTTGDVDAEALTRDAQGRVHTIQGTDLAREFAYDRRGRLTMERHLPSTGIATVRTYDYDWVDNRTGRETLTAPVGELLGAWNAGEATTVLGDPLPAGWTAAGDLSQIAIAGDAGLVTPIDWLPAGKAVHRSFELRAGSLPEDGAIGFGLGTGTPYHVRLHKPAGASPRLEITENGQVVAYRSGLPDVAELELRVILLASGRIVAQVAQPGAIRPIPARTEWRVQDVAQLAPVAVVAVGSVALTGLEWDQEDTAEPGDVVRDVLTYVVADVDGQRVLTNRLESHYRTDRPGVQTFFTYDALNRRSARQLVDSQDGTLFAQILFSYDALGRLTGLRSEEDLDGDGTFHGWREEYAYHAGSELRRERRRFATLDATLPQDTWTYSWRDSQLMAERHNDEEEQRYFYALADEPAGSETATGAPIAFARDALGDITRHVGTRPDGTLGILKRQTFDAYGVNLSHAAFDAGSGSLVPTPFDSGLGYKGQTHDAETGLIYLRHRYYEPETGQFTQVDPARARTNWFAYTTDPVNRWDPSGLDYIDYDGEDVYWVVEENGITYNADKARYKIGTRSSWTTPGVLWGTNTHYGSTIQLDDEFGGGTVDSGSLETYASRLWQRHGDISGMTEEGQKGQINWFISNVQGGSQIGYWEGTYSAAAVGYTRDAALGVGQGSLNTIDGAKNTILAIPDLPRNVWNAGVWWNAKAYSLVGLNDGVPDMWVEGDWSVPQAEWMHTWNDNLIVQQSESGRAWSEGLGGAGAVMLIPIPKIPKWGAAPKSTGATTTEAATAAVNAEEKLRAYLYVLNSVKKRPGMVAETGQATEAAQQMTLSYLRGIDFTKSVEVVIVPKGTPLIQYQPAQGSVGNWFAYPGTQASTLGILPSVNSVRSLFAAPRTTSALRSTARDTVVDWVPGLPPTPATGSGTQLYAPTLRNLLLEP